MARKRLGTSEVWHDADLKRKVAACGSNFFERGTMRFFDSRLAQEIHPAPSENATYFVTSEKGPSGVRRYTVRRFKNCKVDTVGEFQAYRSSRAAHHAAAAAARRVR